MTVALAACGSSGSSGRTPRALLKQTFSGPHGQQRQSELSLNVAPSGSNTLNGPITLSFGGPFQSRGKGKLPASNFNISISALGHSRLTRDPVDRTSGYVTLRGTSYQLPAATFQKLESSFARRGLAGRRRERERCRSSASIHCTGSSSRRSSATRRRRDDDEAHQRGRGRRALLGDINTFLGKASSLGVTGAVEAADEHLAGDPHQGRRRDQEPERRRLDRHRRQDGAEAGRSG